VNVVLAISAILLAMTGCGPAPIAAVEAPLPPLAPAAAPAPTHVSYDGAKQALFDGFLMMERVNSLPPEQRPAAKQAADLRVAEAMAMVTRLTPEQRDRLIADVDADLRAMQDLADRNEPPAVSEPKVAAEKTTVTNGPVVAQGAQVDWVVAVMDLETTGAAELNDAMQRGFTDQIRVFLGVRRIKVVDRGAQENALKEIVSTEKKNSYRECVDESCQIPLGKALAASHILRSSLGRFGSLCTLNGELIDLRTEVTVAAATQRASSCADDQLLDAAEKLTDGLIGQRR
jgi:hypothetical protein